MENAAIKKAHSLLIKDVTTVTGLRSVVSVGDKEVRLALDGKYLTLTGDHFSAERLSVEEGVIVLSGEVTGVRYSSAVEPKSIIKRLFK